LNYILLSVVHFDDTKRIIVISFYNQNILSCIQQLLAMIHVKTIHSLRNFPIDLFAAMQCVT